MAIGRAKRLATFYHPLRIEPLEARQMLVGEFTDLGDRGLVNVAGSSMEWGDYDNDGDLDVLLNGILSGSGIVSRVYRNAGGSFSDISAGLIGLFSGSVAWGDYDNDGDLDILLTGRINNSTPFTRVYRNSGGSFSDISAGLSDVKYSSVAWGDYDNDGDLDILLTGATGGPFSNTPIARLYRNTSGSFSDISTGLTGVHGSSAAWGDYDNDGDLDILLSGGFIGDSSARVYRNNSSTANAAPSAPTDLGVTSNGLTSVMLSWTAPSDNVPTPSGTATPTAGLGYNLRVGTTPGGSDVVGPMSFQNPPTAQNRRPAQDRPARADPGYKLDASEPDARGNLLLEPASR